MIIQILVTQRQPVNTLRHQFAHLMLDALLRTMIGETVSKPFQYSGPALHLAQQQSPAVGRDLAAVEPPYYFPRK